MKENQDKPANAADPSINSPLRQGSGGQAGQALRRLAEERLKAREQTPCSDERLVHELQVHQIELEMQNEELQQARAKADAALAQYADLYDFAPTGYMTLDREGAIRQVNLIGAHLLGVERSQLVNRRLGLFVAESDRRAFSDFLEKVFASHAKECCEVTLSQEGAQPLVVWIEGTRSADGQECRAVMLDITEHKQAEDALRESEQQYREIFDGTPDGVIVHDANGVILDANNVTARNLETTRVALLGRSLAKFVTSANAAGIGAHAANALSGKEQVFEKTYVSASGKTTLTEVHEHRIQWKGREAVLSISRDITERKRAEERIRKLNRVYAMLSNVNQAIVRMREPQALYEEACRIAVEEGGFRMACIGLTDPTNRRVLPAAHAGVTDGYLEKLDIVLGDDTWGREPTGSTMRTGERMVCNDIENEPHMTPWREEALRNGYHSSATFPLKVSGEVRGVFGLYATEPRFFDEDEVKLLDELAMDIGFAMEFAVRETERKQAEEKLVQNYEMATAMNALMSLSMEDRTVAEFLERALNLIVSIKWLAFEDAKGSVFLADDKGEELRMQAEHKLPEALRVKCERVPFGYCICGRAAAAREVQFTDHVDERHETQYDGMAPHGHYCVPILSGDRVLGVINLYLKAGHAHNPQEVEFLKAVANTLAGAIQRKRAEEALQLFRTLVDQSSDAIETLDPETGRFLDVNERGCLDLGYSREEYLALRVFDVDPMVDPPAFTKVVAELRKSGVLTWEGIHRRKDGSIFPVEVNLKYVRLDRDYMVTVARDFTERKRMEEKIRIQLEELQRWQEVTLGREGRVVELKREVNALLARLAEKPRYEGDDQRSESEESE